MRRSYNSVGVEPWKTARDGAMSHCEYPWPRKREFEMFDKARERRIGAALLAREFGPALFGEGPQGFPAILTGQAGLVTLSLEGEPLGER